MAASALRFYEQRGLIASERAGSGHRRYPRPVLRRIAFIVFAQRVGLSLDEIGAELARLPSDRAPDRADWERLSSAWTERIDARIAELERLRRRPDGVHRLRLPVAEPLPARQPGRSRQEPGPRPALLAGRPELRDGGRRCTRTASVILPERRLIARDGSPAFQRSTRRRGRAGCAARRRAHRGRPPDPTRAGGARARDRDPREARRRAATRRARTSTRASTTSFRRVCTNSTVAVARWIAGDDLEVTHDSARETSKIFGELAAHRAASLQEVTRRSFWWRNVMADVTARLRARSCGTPQRRARRRARDAPAQRRVQPAARVRVLRARAPAHRRGAHPARGGARVPGHPRPAHGPAQPHADPRPRRADARPRGAQRRRRWPRCSSTSTTSRRSTTRSATTSATNCCRRSRRASRASCARSTRSGASAATSSS